MRMLISFLILVLTTGCANTEYANVEYPAIPVVGEDPPSRVARISLVQGEASMRLSGTDDWTAAVLNRPLTSGDSVWTGEGGRMELHLGRAALRLNSTTSLSLVEIGSTTLQVKVNAGTVSLHLRELDEDEVVQVDTPDASASIDRPGQYRFDVMAEIAGTRIVTRNGSAEVLATGSPASFRLDSHRQLRIPRGANEAEGPLDAFDRFCVDRDAREDRAIAGRHLSPGTIGYEDLDEYGDWRSDVAFGPVWTPRNVPVGWSPYRFGHWVSIPPWGWTWIDDLPWGFAPFHYGRWLFTGVAWVWIPGPHHRHPVYAPALVVFLGGGRPGLRYHLEINAGFGVAWFPLGPHEVWLPPYRVSRNYLVNVNVTHTVIHDVRNIHRADMDRQRYANRGFREAVTAVPEGAFRRGDPVRRNLVPLEQRQHSGVLIGGSSPAVTPSRESRVGSESLRRDPPPAAVRNRERQSAATPSLRRPLPPPRPPSAIPAPAPQASKPVVRPPRQDQQWDRRVQRDEVQRKSRIEQEQRQSRPAPTTRSKEQKRRPE
jgi:hypothetical protein